MNDAIASTDANRVAAFFRKFQQEAGAGGSQPSSARGQRSSGGQIYTREMIGQLYERHSKGEFTEAAWAKIEADIFAAQHEGRVQGLPYLTK